jgi:hypothetical protein
MKSNQAYAPMQPPEIMNQINEIPPLYLETDRARISPSLLHLVDTWDLHSRNGLLITGPRTGKTRAACILLQRYQAAGQSTAMVLSTEIEKIFHLKDWERLGELENTDVILVDSLGMEYKRPAFEAELSYLCPPSKPCILTSHLTPSQTLLAIPNSLPKNRRILRVIRSHLKPCQVITTSVIKVMKTLDFRF